MRVHYEALAKLPALELLKLHGDNAVLDLDVERVSDVLAGMRLLKGLQWNVRVESEAAAAQLAV